MSMSFPRLGAAILLGLTLSACGTKTPPPAPVEPGPSLEVREGAAPVTVELTTEDLKDRLGINQLVQKREDGRTIVGVAVENLTTAETMVLEFSALYSDFAGKPLFTSDWQNVVLGPGQKYEFYSETSDPGVGQGAPLMRQIMDPRFPRPTPRATPTPTPTPAPEAAPTPTPAPAR